MTQERQKKGEKDKKNGAESIEAEEVDKWKEEKEVSRKESEGEEKNREREGESKKKRQRAQGRWLSCE